jgi:hypothetical protein
VSVHSSRLRTSGAPVLNTSYRPALVIDCAEIAKAKTDGQLVSALADQTGEYTATLTVAACSCLSGYYPVFSFLSSLNGLIDLASVGLIGQKGA